MTAISPHHFAPQPLDPEALIEEARRRAHRRRLAYTAAALACIVAGVLLALLVLTWVRGATGLQSPPGFTVAKARGPVVHAVLEYDQGQWRITDVATGLDRPAKVTEEIWYDHESGLWRDVFRIDGRIKSELAGKCRPSPERLPCEADLPLRYLRPFPWPPARSGYREAGRGSVRGNDVIWLEPQAGLRAPPNDSVVRIGLDPGTHRMVVAQAFFHGRPAGSLFVSQKRDLAAARVRFLVPRQRPIPVTPNATYDPWSGLVHAYGFPAARNALARPPLWLGPRFRGYALRSVTSGVYLHRPGDGRAAPPMRFVRFYYGEGPGREPIISIEELGPTRPYFEKQGPRPGSFERVGTTGGRLTRGGLLLRVATDLRFFPLTAKNAVSLARALRPLPRGLRTLPTLRQA